MQQQQQWQGREFEQALRTLQVATGLAPRLAMTRNNVRSSLDSIDRLPWSDALSEDSVPHCRCRYQPYLAALRLLGTQGAGFGPRLLGDWQVGAGVTVSQVHAVVRGTPWCTLR